MYVVENFPVSHISNLISRNVFTRILHLLSVLPIFADQSSPDEEVGDSPDDGDSSLCSYEMRIIARHDQEISRLMSQRAFLSVNTRWLQKSDYRAIKFQLKMPRQISFRFISTQAIGNFFAEQLVLTMMIQRVSCMVGKCLCVAKVSRIFTREAIRNLGGIRKSKKLKKTQKRKSSKKSVKL